MLEFLALGLGLGLAAGLSPGPLIAMVVAQSLRHGTAEGLKIAVAPLLTDLPIVALALVADAMLATSKPILGWSSLGGAVFVCYIGIETMLGKPPDPDAPQEAPNSWLRGAAVNALSPHPYLFWILVGAPTLIKAWGQGPSAAAGFLAGFYLCLVGSKALIAIVVGRSAGFLRGRLYRATLYLLGALLIVFAFVLTFEGLALLHGG